MEALQRRSRYLLYGTGLTVRSAGLYGTGPNARWRAHNPAVLFGVFVCLQIGPARVLRIGRYESTADSPYESTAERPLREYCG